MRASVYHGKGEIRIDAVPDSRIEQPTDAVVRITHACICGSDLWFYRGLEDWKPGYRTGHEWMGVVEEVGSEVRTVKKGDRVIAPFAFSDGTCEYCHHALQTSCVHGDFWGGKNEGGQAEAIRAPFADGTLVALPPSVEGDETLLRSILPLTDVMGTGHHAAVSAGVGTGSTVAVVGDGAVGLCGVLSARRLGAARIILLGRHEPRVAIARRFGATDVVAERGEEGVAKVLEMTGGGAPASWSASGSRSRSTPPSESPGRAGGWATWASRTSPSRSTWAGCSATTSPCMAGSPRSGPTSRRSWTT